MKTNFVDSLDAALDRIQNGEAVTAVLHDYPTQAEALAPLLASVQLLTECEPVQMPSPAELLADQHQFIDQIAQLPPPAVSPSPFMRLNNWMVHMLSWLGLNPNRTRKEHKKMGTLLLKATLILSIIFGSMGGTAVMAAESLPDSPLYPAKMMMEGVRLQLASDKTEEAEIHIAIAGERLQEMEHLMVSGKMPDDALLTRAEKHIESAFGLAAEMPVQNMAGVLAQAQTMVQTRTRAFAEIEAEIPAEIEPAYKQVRQMLKNTGEVAAAGLQDPQLLRNRHTTNRPEDAPVQPEMLPPAIISATQTITTPVRMGPAGSCAANEDCDPQGDGPYGPNYNGPQSGEPGAGAGPGEPNGSQNGPPEGAGSEA
ncbi:MAG: hypothetical protein IAF02_17345, partial [Anaerolineae bacterium]|nr:hypothetical protein [Anaerolineae bacterium]